MRTYIEAREIRQDELVEPEFVRLDVTGKTQAEEQAILAALKDVMAGLSCQFTRHECHHDEEGSCITQVLNAVNGTELL